MSLSKIVGNLRSKLKDEERKNQSNSLKIEQLLKEKESIKNTVSNMKREKKLSSRSVPAKPKAPLVDEFAQRKVDARFD
jgi:hypothetical protein